MQAKVVEARIGCAVRASFCGISRILFPLSRDGDHLSHSVSRAPSPPSTTFSRSEDLLGSDASLKVVLDGAGCDYYPRVSSRIRGKSGQATLPLLCLAPHGVFRAAPLTRMPGGLLPRLFTLTQHHPASSSTTFSQSEDLLGSYARPESGAGWCWMVLGGIFSVTLSVTRDSRPGRPRFHGACCLSVFGLSSGKTSVKPAITRHVEKIARSEVEC